MVLYPVLHADIAAVKAEPNLEHRSDRALENAFNALDAAKKAYKDADNKGFHEALGELRESVDVSYKSLNDTGKAARRNPKYFKRAQMKLHDLGKRLDTFEKDVSIDERAPVIEVKKRVDELEDEILLQIMTKKK
jgi:hypothetical protein